MRMHDELEHAFSELITKEFESAMLYRQLAVEMQLMHLPGIARWLRVHADKETSHGDRLMRHLTDRDNHPRIGVIALPEVKVTSVTELFQIALAAEREVFDRIRTLHRLGGQHYDVDSAPVIDWLIEEQIDEEASVREFLGRARLVEGDGAGTLALDAEIGAAAEKLSLGDGADDLGEE